MYYVLLIIVLILIFRRFSKKNEHPGKEIISGEFLTKTDVRSASDKKYVGKRVIGYTIQPSRDITVTHIGMPYVVEDSTVVGIYDGENEMASSVINRESWGGYGISKLRNAIQLKAGSQYHVVGIPDSQPVVEFTPIDYVVKIIGQCWRDDNSWGPPQKFKKDGRMVVGPNLVYT